MAAIRYSVINGWLPLTVYLMQGETEIAHNVHNAFEEGQFTDVLEGEYTLLFVDDVGCSDSVNIPTTTTTTTCDPLLCDYGLLYNWYAVGTEKLAPTGWHVPTDDEWTTLSTYLGGEEVAGGKMKTTGLCDWAIPNTDATNESGFSALPFGWRELWEGAFTQISYYSTWWSSSVIAETWSSSWYTSYDNASLFWDYYDSGHGWGVRCLMDSPEDWYEGLKMTDIDGNDYDTVKIGNQVWTVQNLKVTHYNDGEAIPNVEDDAIWMTLTTGALCAYNNDWNTYACVPEPTTTTTTTTVAPTTTTTTIEPTTTTTTTESNEFIIDTLSGYTGFADTYDNGDPDIHGQSFCAHGTISEFSIYCYVNTANLDLRATVYSTVPTHLGATYPPTGYLGQSTNTINTTTLSTDYENPSLVTFYFDDIEVDGEFFIDITYENVVYHHDGTLWIARGPVGSLSYMIYIGDLHFWVKYEYGYLSSRLVGIGDACTTTTTTTVP